jgi:AmiR/NasT family two-component response regulator
MSMNFERAAMRGKLAEAEDEQYRLKSRIESIARAMRQGLNTTLYVIEALEIPQLDEQWDMLKSAWAEYLRLDGEIARLKKELN